MEIVPERNNAQYQPLTVVLRNIIREYPAGGGVLRELCQNADDAGATEIEFVLDQRQHTQKDLLHEGLAEYQGISLLAYNNSTFSEQDFDSLSRIGDSAKANNPNSTGKFGRGFNSVYNWTDNPFILSGSSLVILDPHHTWSASPQVGQPGGPVYNFVKYSRQLKMKNQLSGFSSILKEFDKPFTGTIIRLPLRTPAQASMSKIVAYDRNTTPGEIIDIFQKFAGELVESLLFLRNVNTITLKIDDKIFAKAESMTYSPFIAGGTKNKDRERAAINAGYKDVFVSGKKDSFEIDFMMDISLYCSQEGNETDVTRSYKYAVSHYQLKDAVDRGLQKWATSQKLFPWIAIAAPLEGYTSFRGRLFSTLPLPVHTKHPTHIHGMFSITPDRNNIHSGGDWTTSEASEAKLGTRWNEWLFRDCVSHTWIRNLEFLQAMTERKEWKFTGWELWPAGSEGGGWKELGTGVLGNVFKRVVARNLKLLPTVDGKTATGNDSLFTLVVPDDLKNALQQAGVPIVSPPENRRHELDGLRPYTLGLNPVTESSVRKLLTGLKGSLGNLSLDARMSLLQYVIADEDFRDIASCDAPLVPVKGGSFHGFSIGTSGDSLFLARDESEDLLFGKSTRIIDINRIPPKTAKMMRKNIYKLNKFTRIKMWQKEDAALYCREYIFNIKNAGENPGETICIQGIREFVEKLWTWIYQQCNPLRSISGSPLWELWLLPLMDDEYRRLSSSGALVLDVSVNRGIGAFLRNTAELFFQRSGKRYRLYTGQGFSSQTSKSLRSCGVIKDYEDIVSLMTWLVENAENFVDNLTDQGRASLLQHLAMLSRDLVDYGTKRFMKEMVSKLNLFRQVVPSVTGERPWISMSSTDKKNNLITYVGVKSMPVAFQAVDTIFIDVSDSDTKNLVTGLDMATCPLPTEVLEKYVVAGITASQGTNESSRTSLVDYALKNSNLLSAKARGELAESEIVPVPIMRGGIALKRPRDTVAPDSPAASLYFPKENRIPIEEFYFRHRNNLIDLGMANTINNEVLIERISEYAKSGYPVQDIAEKAQHLITRSRFSPALTYDTSMLHWIPARYTDGTLKLCKAGDCRDRSFESRVKYAMPIVNFPVGAVWSKYFGWDQPLEMSIVLKQLEGAVKAEDNPTIENVVKQISASQSHPPPELVTMEWIPCATGGYYPPTKVFLEDFRSLAPYFGTPDSRFKKLARQLFTKLGVKMAPSFEQLRELQNELAAKGTLGQSDLEMAIYIVKEVGRRYANKVNPDEFRAPDRNGRMRFLSELTAGDPGSTQTELPVLHPGIALDTSTQLKLATFQDRFLGMLNDPNYEGDFAQRESPKAVIDDTLKRYPIGRTFNEYLANAEDAGSATKICWILDDSNNYSRENLLSSDLAKVQGPALFCYNDGKFSDNDFNGIIDIGIGSKRSDPSKIGKFGKGALTMYHWTSVPSFISGDHYVIFDPEQKHLPAHPVTKRPRGGMKIRIEHVREQWPEQLRPFEGISGFSEDSKSFSGTLFRFPLSWAGARGKITAAETRKHLENYFEEAKISLLFLKRMTSISFWDKGCKEPNWVISAKASVPPNLDETVTNITHLTVKERLSNVPLESQKSISSTWCIISGNVDPPPALAGIIGKERLESRYGLAALLSGMSETGFNARHFVGLPLPKTGKLGVPVHVNADTIIPSNRLSISVGRKDEGSEWNTWIFEKGVAALYLDLVKYLMDINKASGYVYWPQFPSQHTDAISKVISQAFWELVRSSAYPLYPPTTPIISGSDKLTTQNLSLKAAIFNLLDPVPSNFFLPLLSKLGVENIVTPSQTVQIGLREIRPMQMRSITPEFLLHRFRSSPTDCQRLLEIWARDEKYSIEFFNKLLTFLTHESSLPLLLDCALLPLANLTLGTFLPPGNQTFLVANTLEECKILEVSENFMVHSGLERKLVDRLISSGLVNITNFQFHDITRLRPVLEERDPEYRKEWLVKVWSYFKKDSRHVPSNEQARLDCLLGLQMYVGKVVGEPSGKLVFLSPLQFQNFTEPAVLEPAAGARDEVVAIQSLKGLILLDRSAFPESLSRQESIRDAAGVYRLLTSIEILARKQGLFINDYISQCLPANRTAMYKNLGKIFTPTIMTDLIKKHPTVKEYLKQLPIWPTNSETPVFQPAKEALLPPHADLASSGMTKSDIFVEKSVAYQYESQLVQLGVSKMSYGDFLEKHVGVSLGREIPPDKKKGYIDLIKTLKRIHPEVFERYPLGVDGEGKFRKLDSLYDFEEQTFVAAFRDQEKVSFLHSDYRGMKTWKNSPLVQKVTEGNYLACIRSIERRASESTTIGDLLLGDARTVFHYLCWDRPEMQQWHSGTWESLVKIKFAPAQSDFTRTPPHRVSRMKELLAGKQLIHIMEAVIPEYASIAWSQRLILEKAPGPFVLRNLPTRFKLSPKIVVDHLIYLSDNRCHVNPAEIEAYIKDIKATYRHLQSCITNSQFHVPPEANIWFNAEIYGLHVLSKTDFQNSWTCSKNLCIGLDCDAPPLRYIRSFLTPFRDLLDFCGIKMVKPPVIQPYLHPITDHTSLLLNGLQRLRQEEQSFDLRLFAEGQVFNAHCTIFRAVSHYWNGMFPIGMRPAADGTYTFRLEFDVKAKTVSAIIDYIYSGTVLSSNGYSGVFMQDLDDIINQLYVSHRWGLNELTTQLAASLCHKHWIRPDTVYQILHCANLVQAGGLSAVCLQYISDNREVVERRSSVASVPVDDAAYDGW